MIIRPENPADIAAIDGVVAAAFGQRSEADLVQGLRDNGECRELWRLPCRTSSRV